VCETFCMVSLCVCVCVRVCVILYVLGMVIENTYYEILQLLLELTEILLASHIKYDLKLALL